MSRILVLVLAVVLGVASTSYGQDYISGEGNPETSDLYGAPRPSGLRFGGQATSSVYTSSGGGGGSYGGGPCPSCMSGFCLDWKLTTWYARWPSNHGGWRHGRCCECP